VVLTIEEKRRLTAEDCPAITLSRRCELLGLNRSSYYYPVKGMDAETERLLKLLDQHYTQFPHEGKIKRARWLSQQVGYTVGKKRVASLMKQMGVATVYPKPNTSVPNKAHEVYPYLLKDTQIIAPDQVWSADITYVPLLGTHVYLMAIIDWYSRFVLEWRISISLETDFCIEALKSTLSRARCDIFNTDQGSQFTSQAWINTLKEHHISISMDGRGRYLDNIFVERLWRTVKQECIYLNEFNSVTELKKALTNYFEYYNYQRLHQALDYRTPATVYFNRAHSAHQTKQQGI
jgi:putative transposase